MKKLLNGLLLLTLLNSCTQNSDGTNSTQNLNSTSGTYKLTDVHTNTAVDLNGDGIFNNNLTKETDCFEGIVIFKEDKSYISSNNKKNIIITLPTRITCNSGSSSSIGTWSENATTIFIITATGGNASLSKENGNSLKAVIATSTTPGFTNPITYYIYTKQ